jgi:Tol biopolymer transport system component
MPTESLRRSRSDIGVLSMSGEVKATPFLKEAFDHSDPQISPDSKWIAYSSVESGRPEIYVASFPTPSGKWQISTDGGTLPKWRRDGKELFYLSLDGHFMSVPVDAIASNSRHRIKETFGDLRSILFTNSDINLHSFCPSRLFSACT